MSEENSPTATPDAPAAAPAPAQPDDSKAADDETHPAAADASPAEAADSDGADSDDANAEGANAEGADDAPAGSAPVTFQDFDLQPEVLRALEDMGYVEPMKVQIAVHEHVRAKKDLMVQSHTGSGKTAAFGIPLIEMTDPELAAVQSLVLAPTRELALQVAREFQNIAKYKSVEIVPVYGGAPIKRQIDALQAGGQIVAGTPGRVLDHIGRGTLDPSKIRMLVLDECDEMLSMGFQEEIEKIISFLPKREERQTLLFSATIPSDIERIGKRHMVEPDMISLSSDSVGVDQIDHFYYVVSGMARTRDLLKVLQVEDPKSAIIFCNTREDTNVVARYLTRHGYDAEAISSDLSQKDRERVMGRMRDKNLRFLVATDVAARGIDISDLSHVINYTFPESPEVYVHRTGRTGRAGKGGVAISLVGPREIGAFYYLKLIYKIRPEERDMPSSAQLDTLREAEKLKKLLARVTDTPGDSYESLARRLWESNDGLRVVASLIKRALEKPIEVRDVEKRTPRADSGDGDDDGDKDEERDGRRRRRRRRDRDDRDDDRRRPRRDRDDKRRSRRDRDDDRRDGDKRDGDRDAEPRAKKTDAEAKPADAKPADAKPADAKADQDADGAAPTRADAPNEDGDDKPKRRRRRRRRNGKADGPKAKGTETTDFWETWADEKDSSDEDGDGSNDAAGDEKAASDDGARDDVGSGVRLYVNIGRREEASADDVRNLLAEGLDEGADAIGRIQVRNTHCYVRVEEEVVDKVIAASEGKSFGGRELVCERAKR